MFDNTLFGFIVIMISMKDSTYALCFVLFLILCHFCVCRTLPQDFEVYHKILKYIEHRFGQFL
jgi:hypothetical protein